MARTPICMHKGCNAIGTHRISIDKRGGRDGFLCDFHARHLEGYSDENGYRAGLRKKNGFTFSMELETSFSTEKARGELLDFGFIATRDCTVDVEYKSPIYEGLNAISKQLVSIDGLMNNGEIAFENCNGDTCGTHFHVGHVGMINPETMGYIRRFYHSLFVLLSDAMVNNPEKTKKLFGRDFTYYASPINNHSDAMDHCNFINLQHDYTIEFRLCKFVSASQYMNLVKFNRDIVNAVIENFVKHFNDVDFDKSRYENATAYRKHKAQVTANKLVKLFEKYSENI